MTSHPLDIDLLRLYAKDLQSRPKYLYKYIYILTLNNIIFNISLSLRSLLMILTMSKYDAHYSAGRIQKTFGHVFDAVRYLYYFPYHCIY